jgi:insertion element IS1 protein InsB
MSLNESSCSKCVGQCNVCGGKMIKYGRTKSGNQRFMCTLCHKSKVRTYIYKAYEPSTNKNIVLLTKEGLGIRSTARILKISATTLLHRIITIAQNVKQPTISKGKTFEVDEMRSYVKRKDKLIWIVYALERESKKVVSLNVGRRTNATLNVVLTTLKMSNPLTIYTDKLKHYQYLIEKSIHTTKRFGTNHIERKNLSLRTHLKRLNRRTICFSKSKLVLCAVLKIYFWG